MTEPNFNVEGNNEKDLSPNIIRRDIDSYDGIDVVSTKIHNPERIIQLRPKGSQLSKSEWLLCVSNWGLEGTLAREFKEWMKKNPGKGYFGLIEENFIPKTPRTNREKNWAEFSEYIFNSLKSANLDDLGRFGLWVKAIGINDKELLFRVVREFLSI